MFSDVIRTALEKEVVGQTRAVHSVVRGVTRVVSGMMPRDRTWCCYMLMGPTGTGKSNLIESLAHILHGDERRITVLECVPFTDVDPWMTFVAQIGSLFAPAPAIPGAGAVLEAPPLSIIQIEYLERAPKEVARALSAVLESGQLLLPDGRRASIRNSLVFITSTLCASEILDDAPPIGFSGTQDWAASPEDRIQQLCHARSMEQFGGELTGSLDGLIVFHALDEQHVEPLLERRFARLNSWMEQRGFECELRPAAREFLLERGRRDLRNGALELVRAHRRFVEFPLADMLISGRVPQRGTVTIDRKPRAEGLHFTVHRPAGAERDEPRDIPVRWEGSGRTSRPAVG